MKKTILWIIMIAFGLAFFSGCASIQTWPDSERNAENKMVVIQEKIGDGLKNNTLTPDQSQMYLSSLKGIRTDYEALRGKTVYQDDWNKIHTRLDALDEEINRASNRTVRPARTEEPMNGNRIALLQRKIDDARIGRRLPMTEERSFQDRLDTIRRDYLRMTDGGRYATYEERTNISRRLDALDADVNRFR